MILGRLYSGRGDIHIVKKKPMMTFDNTVLQGTTYCNQSGFILFKGIKLNNKATCVRCIQILREHYEENTTRR